MYISLKYIERILKNSIKQQERISIRKILLSIKNSINHYILIMMIKRFIRNYLSFKGIMKEFKKFILKLIQSLQED